MSDTSLVNRLLGVISLKAPIYREIAEDSNALVPAGVITVAAALVSGVGSAFVSASLPSMFPAEYQSLLASSSNPILSFITSVVSILVMWGVGSWVFAFAAKMMGGRTNTGEMLRILGHVNVVDFLNLIPCVGALTWILKLVAMVIGIREASEFDTTKAVITGLIGVVMMFIVQIVINAVLGVIGGAIGLIG